MTQFVQKETTPYGFETPRRVSTYFGAMVAPPAPRKKEQHARPCLPAPVFLDIDMSFKTPRGSSSPHLHPIKLKPRFSSSVVDDSNTVGVFDISMLENCPQFPTLSDESFDSDKSTGGSTFSLRPHSSYSDLSEMSARSA